MTSAGVAARSVSRTSWTAAASWAATVARRCVAAARGLACEDAALFAIVVALGLPIAALYAFQFHVFQGDALARTYQAAMVLYAARPGIANVSFIWTPLPALAQVPLLVDARLTVNGFSSQIISVGFSAGSLVVLNRIVRSFIVSRLPRYLLLASYHLNPMVLVYAVNGMTESVLIFFVLVGVWALGRFHHTFQSCAQRPAGSFRVLAIMGGAAALAFLSRYEGLVFGLALGAAVVVLTLRRSRESAEQTEGLLIAYAAPYVYAVAVWVIANWLVMGDPLYFMNGRGSNREQAMLALAAKPELAAASGDVVRSLEYVTGLLAHLYPASFAVVGLLLAVAWRHRDRFALGLVLIMLCFPLFQLLLHVAGQSFGYARFYIYVIPMTIVGAAYLGSRVHGAWRAVACALVLTSSVSTINILPENSVWSANEDTYFLALGGFPVQDRFAPERDMARALDEVFASEPDARVLFDDLRGSDLAVFSGMSDRFVGTRDPQFATALADPGAVVQYVLVSDMADGSDVIAQTSLPLAQPHLELVHETPPELWRQAGEEIDKPTAWRLYRVVRTEAPA